MSYPPEDLVALGTRVEPLAHNATNAATGGIWRVHRPTGSAILKIVTPSRDTGTPAWATSDDPRHWNHWRREALAYRHGFAGTVYADAGLRAPELLDAIDRPDGSIALWLEDVDGVPGTQWTVEEFGAFATRLGTAQAEWIGRDLPYPWLSRDWLRQYLAARPVPDRVDWDHPVLARLWPESLRHALAALWLRRDELSAIVDHSPRTLAHLDVWPLNLIRSAAGDVLLDWSFVGSGAVGEDIGNLVVDAVADGHIAVEAMPALIDAAIDGYIIGLGGRADAASVRRAVAASAAAKYAWFGPRVADRFIRDGAVGSGYYDVGGSAEERIARWRPMLTEIVGFAGDVLDP